MLAAFFCGYLKDVLFFFQRSVRFLHLISQSAGKNAICVKSIVIFSYIVNLSISTLTKLAYHTINRFLGFLFVSFLFSLFSKNEIGHNAALIFHLI